MVDQPSLNRPSSGNEKAGDSESVTGLSWQDFHLDAPQLASAPWCPQKRHLLRGLSHCCVLRPSLLSSPASPSTLFPGLFTSHPSPHENNQVLYHSLLYSCHPLLSTKRQVRLCGGTGPSWPSTGSTWWGQNPNTPKRHQG